MTLATKIGSTFVWAAMLVGGMRTAWRYETTPGRVSASTDWPVETGLSRDPEVPTLLMFVHPHCPCSQVTFEGLGAVLARSPQSARVEIVVVLPRGLEGDWRRSESAAAARGIPDVILRSDPDGLEARRFGARTSGQIYAFSPEGKQVFRGGATASRGQLGPNEGLSAIKSILSGRAPAVRETPVYGCSLLGEESR